MSPAISNAQEHVAELDRRTQDALRHIYELLLDNMSLEQAYASLLRNADAGRAFLATLEVLGDRVWSIPKSDEEWHQFLQRETERLAAMPYPEYLRSPEWGRVRAVAYTAANHRCQVCNSKGELHVHHRTYKRRGAESLGDLVVLCSNCHELFHRHRRIR